MEVDLDSCLKSLRNSFHHLKNQQTEENVKNFEREVNVLVGVTNKRNEKILKEFNPQNLLHAETLSIFVSILSETSLKESIYGTSISLLHGLATSTRIRKSLQNTFKLTSTLLSLIMKHQNDHSILFQCLQLLQQVTYRIKIESPLGEMATLLKYLVSKVVSSETKMTMACLGSLANLCRNNPVVQDYIKNMSNVKTFFKCVASFLSHDNWMNIIHSLSLLSISLNEPLGEKVFNKKNIDQTFLLIFNVLLNGGSLNTLKYSCDLLIDLLKCRRMQEYLASYTDLQSHVTDLVYNLREADEESCEKLLELLLCLDCVPNLLKTIFFKEDDDEESTNDGSDDDDDVRCLPIVLDIIAKRMASRYRVASLALKLIKILYQKNPPCTLEISKLVPILSKSLETVEEDDSENLKDRFGNTRRSIEIIQILLNDTTSTGWVTEFLNPQSIHHFITTVSSKFGLEFTSEYQSNNDYRLEISSVFVGLIELLSAIVKLTDNGEDLLVKLLQSTDSFPFLACCLSSQSINLVERSLKIIHQTGQSSHFSLDTLSIIIAKSNKNREDEISALKKQQMASASIPRLENVYMPTEPRRLNRVEQLCNGGVESSAMASLADRISSGLEIKDSTKLSEIMDIYEHKLAAIQVKEMQLQDLLDAKTAALSQSDHFIAQYRCRSAQSEAECLKLRSLLLESQKRSEEQQEKIKSYIKDLKSFTEKAEYLTKENKILNEKSLELERLKIAHDDKSHRLDAMQGNLTAMEEEQRSLTEMNGMLKKHCDNLKSQYDCTQQQLRENEQEKSNMMNRMKEKDKKIEETSRRILQMEEKVKQQSNDLHEIEKKLKLAETELNFAEETRKEVNQKIEVLEREKNSLLEVAEEFEQLQVAHEDHKQRLETIQRSLEAAEKENMSLSELNTVLQKQGDSLKSKQENLVQNLKEIEKNKQITEQELMEKGKTLEESLNSISMLKQEAEEKEDEMKCCQKKLKSIEKQLKQSEKMKVDLNHKLSSLAVLNEKYEREIKENEILVQDLKSQLEKHSQIAAMIHNLSSGKVPSNGLNFGT